MNEPYKCVIDFTEKRFDLKSTDWKVNRRDGLHWIVDGSDHAEDRVIVPFGHDCIEVYAPMDAKGNRPVVRTYIPEVGVIKGSLPADRVVWLKDVIQEAE